MEEGGGGGAREGVLENIVHGEAADGVGRAVRPVPFLSEKLKWDEMKQGSIGHGTERWNGEPDTWHANKVSKNQK